MAKYSKSKKPKGDKLSTEELVIQSLIQKIKSYRVLPWTTPFVLTAPKNYITGKAYNGINRWLLYDGSGEYITFNQLKQFNEGRDRENQYLIKKGSQGQFIIYYSNSTKNLTEADVKVIRDRNNGNLPSRIRKQDDGTYVEVNSFLKGTFVFDIKNIVNSKGESLPSKLVSDRNTTDNVDGEEIQPIIDKYMQAQDMKQIQVTGQAYHERNQNIIAIPPMEHFHGSDEYYRVVFHELMHSTGVERRLARKSLLDYHHMSTERSAEELVAEVGSSMLSVYFGFPQDTFASMNSTIYIAGWLKWIEDNPKKVIKALKDAEESVEYFLSFSGRTLKDSEEPIEATILDGFETNRASDKTGQVKKHQKPLEDYIKDMIENNEVVGNNRGSKLSAIAKDKGFDLYIKDELKFEPFIEHMDIPTYIYDVNEKKKLIVSYTFVIEVNKATDKYKLLFRIESGNTVKEINQFARQYKLKDLEIFTKFMTLSRRKIDKEDVDTTVNAVSDTQTLKRDIVSHIAKMEKLSGNRGLKLSRNFKSLEADKHFENETSFNKFAEVGEMLIYTYPFKDKLLLVTFTTIGEIDTKTFTFKPLFNVGNSNGNTVKEVKAFADKYNMVDLEKFTRFMRLPKK